ncbi:hypothetical protein DMUE_0577 [Dictyocoela muelleri]|nr:hypothetical protein DMUE_0577 [Dictyocoela muelleri]
MYLREVIYEISKSDIKTIQSLMDHEILKRNMKCLKCKKHMRLKGKDIVDRYIWRCNTVKCLKRGESVRKGSHFFEIRIKLSTILRVIYEWAVNTTIKKLEKRVIS